MNLPTNQLSGGGFQDLAGNPLAFGYLLFYLNEDVVAYGSAISGNEAVKILLDTDGNIQTNPAQSIWPNDAESSGNTYYLVSAYSAAGQLVWGPNAQQVLSTPTPFDVSVWVPGIIVITN